MEIKLNKLTLENFKGVKNFVLDAQGQSVVVSGQNGAGKTTLMDAFLWLLFNKNSEGKSDFAIKTLDAQGQEIHNLNHSVEGALSIDGKEITLKKMFLEKWTKKRGSSHPDFTGHTTEYSINGVPVKKKEWDKKISELIDEETFKLLTSPVYFNSLHWQKRREILLQVCGDIKDSDVIASDKDLKSLPDILGDRSIDDHKKVVAGQKKTINDKLKEIPARIDELNKSISDTSSYDVSKITTTIKDLEEQIRTAKDDKSSATLRQQKAELQAKILEAQNFKQEAVNTATKDIDKVIDDLEDEQRKAVKEKERVVSDIPVLVNRINDNNNRMSSLRKEFTEVSEKEFKGETSCPACGQSLPEDQIQAATEKFNTQKADKLAKINEQGKAYKAEVENLTLELKELETRKGDLESKIAELADELEKILDSRGDAISKARVKWDGLITKLQSEIDIINTKIAEDIPADTSGLEAQVTAERTKLAEIESAKKAQARMKELADEEKKLANEYGELERQTFLMEKFIVAKVGMLEEKINSRFKLASFKLFDVQINGGVNECCETLYHGSPYTGGLSTGEQIVIGLDIINTLQEYYCIKSVVFLDHRESLTSEPEIVCQLISLTAAQDYDQLTVITQEQEERRAA